MGCCSGPCWWAAELGSLLGLRGRRGARRWGQNRGGGRARRRSAGASPEATPRTGKRGGRAGESRSSPEQETAARGLGRRCSGHGGGARRRGSVESAVRRGGGLGTEGMEAAGLGKARRKARAANGDLSSPESRNWSRRPAVNDGEENVDCGDFAARKPN